MVYLKSVENVITLGKLIGLLFLFCLPLLSILFLKTKRNDLARPVMGTIFLVVKLNCHYQISSYDLKSHITFVIVMPTELQRSFKNSLQSCKLSTSCAYYNP